MSYNHEKKAGSKEYSGSFPRHDPLLDPLAERYVRLRGLSYDLARTNGWYPSRSAGDAHPRLVIPATSSQLQNCFWQARALTDATPRYQSPHGARGDAIILVWPGVAHATFNGSVIVEGPFDALAAAEWGALGIALMGNSPSQEVIEFVAKVAQPPVTVVADLDAVSAGVAIMKLVYGAGRIARLVSPYPYKDLAECPHTHRNRLLP